MQDLGEQSGQREEVRDLGQTHPFAGAIDHPGKGLGEGVARNKPAGLADGRRARVSPLLRTVVHQLTHQGGVRQEDEVHIPCLALTTPELTRDDTQVLLPVPMEGLTTGSALAVGLQDAMVELGGTDRLGEVLLRDAGDGDLRLADREQVGSDPSR